MKIVSLILSPLVFGLGFITPLFNQILTSSGTSIAGLDNLYIALAMALIWGLIAQLRGSWIWIKL